MDTVFKTIVFKDGTVEIRDRHDNPLNHFGSIKLATAHIEGIMARCETDQPLRRESIIDAACDLYGYTRDDFTDLSAQEIVSYLADAFAGDGASRSDILAQIQEYNG